MAKTLWSFGHSKCNRVETPKMKIVEFAHKVDPVVGAHNDNCHFFLKKILACLHFYLCYKLMNL